MLGSVSHHKVNRSTSQNCFVYHGSLWSSEGTPPGQSPASAELASATNQPHGMKSEATGRRPALQKEVCLHKTHNNVI